MKPRHMVLLLMAATLAVGGYFFAAIVVAIYAGLWLHGEKMYFAQGLSAQIFGVAGAVAGAGVAWLIWWCALIIAGRNKM
jgi:hypothetical protein